MLPVHVLRYSSKFCNFLCFLQPQGLSYILMLFLQYFNYTGLSGIMPDVSKGRTKLKLPDSEPGYTLV